MACARRKDEWEVQYLVDHHWYVFTPGFNNKSSAVQHMTMQKAQNISYDFRVRKTMPKYLPSDAPNH